MVLIPMSLCQDCLTAPAFRNGDVHVKPSGQVASEGFVEFTRARARPLRGVPVADDRLGPNDDGEAFPCASLPCVV
jgi:hypothetical protein